MADIRRALFDKVMGMSPAYFEKIMTGEILSRITTDTTLILSVIGSSISVALRNLLTLIGGLVLLMLTSTKLTLLVLLIVPGDRRADRGAGAQVARLVARQSRLDRAILGSCLRGIDSGADRAGFHA